jgi:hypothetical protein
MHGIVAVSAGTGVALRKLALVAGLVATSVALSACGSASAKATLHELVGSLGSSPDLQVTLTASAAHTPSAEAPKVLGVFSVEMLYENPSGGALSRSGGNANSEFVVKVSGTPLLDIREVDSNVYAYANASAISSIPGVKLSGAELAEINLVLGGRWFEFPKSLIEKALPTTSASKAENEKVRSVEVKLIDDVVNVIVTTPSTKLASGGYSQTGTLQSIVSAVEPTLLDLTGHRNDTSAPIGGTYELTVLTSGTSATGASISITAASGATVGLAALFAHAEDAIAAPTHATVITPQLLSSFDALGRVSSMRSSSSSSSSASYQLPAR